MPAPRERLREAATVILTRRAPRLEVFLVERNLKTRFFPGYHVFPGGVVDPEDGEGHPGRRRAAARELAEETGVRVDPAALVEAGTLVTPPFGPLRYDTTFYVCACPEGETPRVEGEELAGGRWMEPAEALRRWEEEAFPLPPPTLAYLRVLAGTGDAEKAAALARATDGRPHHERFRIEMHPGVSVLPLRAPTLPPATTQNCWVLEGERLVVVVDPGTPHADERAVLFHALDQLGEREGVVVLTHHHHDHVASAQDVRTRYGWRVLAHAATRDALPAGLVDGTLADGDALELGSWRGRPWRLEALHTPGHAPGHLALRDSRWGAIFAGDLVSGVSTILVPPGEGDMAQYMASLARCASLSPPAVLPGHGPLLPGGAFAKTLEHRRMREEKALAALTATPQAVDALVPTVYDDTPREAWALAEASLESVLLKLEREGRAARREGGWTKP